VLIFLIILIEITLKQNYISLAAICFCLFITACSPKITEKGKASFYADSFQGKQTANGEVFKQNKKTAAHKTLPFGTKVKVTNLKNGKTVTVRINDRGPFVAGRIIDLSKGAAQKIDMKNDGIADVKIKFRKNKKAKNKK
jgi:rare lipoprotein A